MRTSELRESARMRPPRNPTRAERAFAVLRGTPIAVTRLRDAARAPTVAEARRAAERAGIRGVEGECALRLRREREETARQGRPDRLASRAAGSFAARYVQGKLQAAYDRCGYRVATHGHEVKFRVDGVAACVEASSGTVRPSKAGLPGRYGYQVTRSFHEITVPVGWLRSVYLRAAAVIGGRLVLALGANPDEAGRYAAAWVEQGRGTSIRLEHGYVERDGGGWFVSGKHRVAGGAR